MESITRAKMAELLLSLEGDGNTQPIEIIASWIRSDENLPRGNEYDQNNFFAKLLNANPLNNVVSSAASLIMKKFQNTVDESLEEKMGFSLNEIVILGNMIEYSSYTTTTLQNWIKRDIKEIIGAPLVGKRYSVRQAALLFIVDDLRKLMDYNFIKGIFSSIFKCSKMGKYEFIDPLHFYSLYSNVYEQVNVQATVYNEILNLNIALENIIKVKTNDSINRLETLQTNEAIKTCVELAVRSIFIASTLSQAEKQKKILEFYITFNKMK
jgi:hypothetical protein